MSTKKRRGSSRKNRQEKKAINFASLTLSDIQCKICFGIFVEPVTLPCDHSLCKSCFEQNLDNNALACPYCRKYIGSWFRNNKKNGHLINQDLWSHIQKHFQSHVTKKLQGDEDEDFAKLESEYVRPKLNEPGEIREEYELQQKRLREEEERKKAEEARASEELIRKIQEQEERELELKRKAEEEDALIAQRIAAELAEEDRSNNWASDSPEVLSAFSPIQVQNPGPSSIKGPMDAFVNQGINIKSPRAGSSTSTDSLRTELRHFKPLHIAPKTPPKKRPDGRAFSISPIRVPVLNIDTPQRTVPRFSGVGCTDLRPWLSRCDDESTSVAKKRKISLVDESRANKQPRIEVPEEEVSSQSLDSPERMTEVTKPNRSSERVSKRISKNQSALIATSFSKLLEPKNSELCRDQLDLSSNKELGNTNINSNDLNDHEYFSQRADAEERVRQEQEDYQFALKLQQELNATRNFNRTYDLRKPVPKVSPRTKLKINKNSNQPSKDKRQRTLEETMSYSVKLGLPST